MNLLEKTIKTLELVKPTDIRVYDMEKSSPFFDYVVVATANERQANALVSYLKEALPNQIKGIEGKTGGWLLVDLKDIIIHIFSEEQRDFYGFDKRLMGLKRVEL
ncbi:ribosome-associated protein [Acholeplasma morum]|jgi:ribosome-associated protein|uniref:ribosome silencing factor n=1 Tax=Paracholeplasma morum TaxID=264637 RepID=UPI00195CDC4F|nr:ribosome silencing factor [Paracholeplasma morum]MBM7453670.1 ribosome-associated protein [Paracholeplasma morum]